MQRLVPDVGKSQACDCGLGKDTKGQFRRWKANGKRSGIGGRRLGEGEKKWCKGGGKGSAEARP